MRYLVIITLLFSSCIAQAKIQNKYTGYEINHMFKSLQNFIVDYEVENGGPVLDNKVSIYRINKNHCVIISKVDGDSGGYGSEDLLYFYNSKFLSGYSLSYSYTYLNSKGTKKSNKPSYMEIIDDSENTKVLRTDFKNYLKKMNKNTLSKCSSKNQQKK